MLEHDAARTRFSQRRHVSMKGIGPWQPEAKPRPDGSNPPNRKGGNIARPERSDGNAQVLLLVS